MNGKHDPSLGALNKQSRRIPLKILRVVIALTLLVLFGMFHKLIVKPTLASVHAEWFWNIYNWIDFLTIPLLAFGCLAPVGAGVVIEMGRRLWGAMTIGELGWLTVIYVFVSWVIGNNALYIAPATYNNIPTVFILTFVPLTIVHVFALLIVKFNSLEG